MSIHLVIIDAMNLIRRVHAAQPETSPIENTAQVCCQVIKKIIHHSAPTHIIAVFDHQMDNQSWRRTLYPAYKQGRKPMPDALKNGLDLIQDSFMAVGVDSLLSQQEETNDIIATLALKMATRQQNITIVSTDKSYCQLLAPHIRIRDYFQERWLDIPFIEKEFGVQVAQLPDYWGLAGVNSNSITGVAGVGAKTASQLLASYPSVESIFKQFETLPEKWQKKLRDQENIALLCKQITTLKKDVSLGFNLQDIRYHAPQH